MNKNWLIRTKNFQILGPVSKDKVKEFITLGKLTPDDEVCSGNGYWFFLSEAELLEKYIYGDVPQTFNVVTEAESVVSVRNDGQTASVVSSPRPREESGPIQVKPQVKLDDEIAIPSNDDLEYPDMSDMVDMGGPAISAMEDLSIEHTPVSSNVSATSAKDDYDDDFLDETDSIEGKLPDSSDLEYPDMLSSSRMAEKDVASEMTTERPRAEEIEEDLISEDDLGSNVNIKAPVPREDLIKVQLKNKFKEKELSSEPENTVHEVSRQRQNIAKMRGRGSKRSDRYLFVLLVVFILFVLSIFVYYKNIFSKTLPFLSNIIVPTSSAQSEISFTSLKKKA